MEIKLISNILTRLLLVIIVILLFIFLPIYHQVTLMQFSYGVLGEVSVTTYMLILMWSYNIIKYNSYAIRIQKRFSFLIIVSGLFLYLSALGFIKFDIYSLGYYPNIFFLIILGLLAIYYWFSNKFFVWIILLALLAFYFRLETSINLWDYLLDPFIWLISIVNIFRKYIKD